MCVCFAMNDTVYCAVLKTSEAAGGRVAARIWKLKRKKRRGGGMSLSKSMKSLGLSAG